MLLARRRMHSAASTAHMKRSLLCNAPNSSRLAVVGDVHNHWSPRDAAALKVLEADFGLFVGDFGNENVPLVQQIASLDMPKAAILGNHDAWYTMTARPRSRSRSPPPHTTAASRLPGSSSHHATQQAADDMPRDRVQQQLDALGDCHVGYAHMALPDTNISLVGARPFSKGGKSFRSIRDFMGRLYDVHDMGESAQRILDVITSQAPHDNSLILMGHNGPAGLGDQRHHICGVDWVKEAGDHGDPDLQSVLQQLRELGRPVSLVVFGHMHHTLKGKGKRQMVHVDTGTGTVYLNAATVPRVATVPQRGPHVSPVSKHHFLVVDMLHGQVHCAADVWVHVTEQAADDLPAQQTSPGSSNAPGSHPQHTCSVSQQQDGAKQQQLVVLDQRLKSVDGFAVRVAEVHEVFRTLGGRSSGQLQEKQPMIGARRIECWDAFHSSWRLMTLPVVATPENVVEVVPASL